ncbi:MAG TPA: NUDIX domain-containing protein [Candidatus Saccharimonadales bacterium]|nr:NUDIX domain-containing protein [Candidatus Saccharimonadales bacterium]
MADHLHPLSEKEFWAIYKKVPRLTVDIVLKSDKGLYLTKRDIEPCKGLWHLPGGTVRFAEPLIKAVQRIAKRELGIEVKKTRLLGYIEYPSHYLQGLDSPVGIAFYVDSYNGKVTPNDEASDGEWFKDFPKEIHDEERDFLKANL